MESSRPIAYLVTLRTCERRVRVSRLGHVRGERENQSRPLGHCDGLRAGGLGAQPQVVASRAGWWKLGRYLPIPGSGRGTRALYTSGRSALATRRCTTWCTVKTSSQARFDELNLTAP